VTGQQRFLPEKVFEALNEAGVRYVVIGGVAATLHGSPRRTGDSDICPAATRKPRMYAAVTDVAILLPWYTHDRKRRNTPVSGGHTPRVDTDTVTPAAGVVAPSGFGKSQSVLTTLAALPLEQQRFALLLVQAVGSVAGESEVSEADVRSMVYRVFQAALLQEQKAPGARRDLARVLGPSLGELDPVPHAIVEQARRLAALRASLLRDGALSTAAIADARGITANNARQWVSRHRKAHRIFTVAHDGETLVPAFLLDDELEPRPAAQEPIRLLHEAGEDGWALWAWFATPSAWVGGRVPSQLLATEPERVAESARQRAAAAA
jgi:hypothetical protein